MSVNQATINKLKQEINLAKLVQFRHASGEIRVWRPNWSSDSFDIIPLEKFEIFFKIAKDLGFIIIGYDVSDNELKCLDWKDVMSLK